MIFMYIIQGLIHGLFDTRRGGIAPLLNSVALITSIVVTVNIYGWRMMWLPFVVIIVGAVFGGILMGLVVRSQRLSTDKYKQNQKRGS